MKKRVRKLMALLMTAIALSWVVPQGAMDALASELGLGVGDVEVDSTNNTDNYKFGSGEHVLTVKEGVTLSGNVDMEGGGSPIQLLNKGTITGTISNVNAGYKTVTNESTGTIQTTLSISGGTITNSGALKSVTLDGADTTFKMTGGTVETLGATADPTIKLEGGTIGTLNAAGTVEITGTPTITTAKVSNFTGAGTVTVVDSVELGTVDDSTVKVNVSPTTKVTVLGGSDVAVTVVSSNNTTKDVVIPSGSSAQTPLALFGKTVTFTTGTGHMSTADALPTGQHWFGESTDAVTYKADNGYYFPVDYASGVICDGTGIKSVTRVDASTIQVSYTLGENETGDITLTLPAATPKAGQAAPTGLVGGANQITGTTTLMEYATSATAADAEWRPCTAGTTAIPMAGTWFLRYRETDEKLAGQSAAVQVLTAGTGSITVEDICYGKKPSPIVSSSTNGTENVRIEYKKKSAADNTYTTVVPTTVGDYTARAIFAGQGLYDRVVATDDFAITFMRLANNPYTISAEKGNNGFYKSIVTVVAKQGYLLAEKLDGNYVSSLTYDTSKGSFSLFAVKKDTGEKSNAIGLAGFKVDRVAPSIDAVDAQTYYMDTVEFAIMEDNLESVSVNGKKVTVDTTGKIAFPSNGGVTDYEVVMTDQAGHTSRVSFTVAAKWTQTGIIPTGQAVLLTTENAYKLGSGTWKVNGDSTSYNGNQNFYVGSEGEYVFTGN